MESPGNTLYWSLKKELALLELKTSNVVVVRIIENPIKLTYSSSIQSIKMRQV